MLLRITQFGEPMLRTKAIEVAEVNDDIRKLADDMLETMYAANGVGLAAEQVGRIEAICVIDIPRDAENEDCREFNAGVKMPLVLVNPKITAREGSQRNNEGCLSFPDIGAQITRANQVTVEYVDLNGEKQSVTAKGLLARAIQHETDHLQGVLLVDKMSSLQKMSVAGQLKRLQRQSALS